MIGGDYSKSTTAEFLLMSLRFYTFNYFIKWSSSMIKFENDHSRDIYDSVITSSMINWYSWKLHLKLISQLSACSSVILDEAQCFFINEWVKQILILCLLWASLVTQMLKNPPVMREIWVWSLGWEGTLKEGMTTHSSIVAWRIPMDRGAWRATVHEVVKRRQLGD